MGRRLRNARFNPPRGRFSHPRFTIVQIRTFGFEWGRFEPLGVQKTFALTPHATIFRTFGSQLFGSNIWVRVQNGGRFGPTAVQETHDLTPARPFFAPPVRNCPNSNVWV